MRLIYFFGANKQHFWGKAGNNKRASRKPPNHTQSWLLLQNADVRVRKKYQEIKRTECTHIIKRIQSDYISTDENSCTVTTHIKIIKRIQIDTKTDQSSNNPGVVLKISFGIGALFSTVDVDVLFT